MGRVQSAVSKTSTPIFNSKKWTKKMERKTPKQKQTTPRAEPLGVNCKWVLKNWPSHLGSTSHLSQTNEAPRASKWDWSPFESRQWTPPFWILRAAPHSPWKPSVSPSPTAIIPSSTGVMWPPRPGGVFNFINIHSFIVNPGSKFSTVLPDGYSPLSPPRVSEMEF